MTDVRIAHITCSFGTGGAERLSVDLCCAMAKDGDTVSFIAIDRPAGGDSERQMREQLAASGVDFVNFGRRPGSGFTGFTGAVIHLAAELRKEKFDVVHSHLVLAHAVAATACRIAAREALHVVTVHSSRETWALWQRWLTGRKPVVYCSESALATGTHPARMRCVIPNGVRLNQAPGSGTDAAPADRVLLGVPPGRRIVLSVGHIKDAKNYETALETIARLAHTHDVDYLVCGGGNPVGLKALAVRSGIADRVHFLGARSDVALLLNTADLFLSISIYEGMPVAVLEAMAAGLPCVLSPIPEHAEIASDMPGCCLARANTPDSLAATCAEMLAESRDRSMLRRARAERMARYEICVCAAAYRELYARLLAAPQFRRL